MIGNFPTKYLQ